MGKTSGIGVVALFVCLVVMPAYAARTPEPIEGRWEGIMTREGDELAVAFDFSRDSKTLQATFDSPSQRALGIPLRNVTLTVGKVHFELAGDTTTIVFDGELQGDVMAGAFRENDAAGTFSLRRVKREPLPYRTEEVSFQNGAVVLSGTFFAPLAMGRHPAVIFTHGSGGEGRFASRFFADYLARRHIAALIYDKRGVGKSTGNWTQASFEDLAEDAIAGIRFLQRRSEINPRQVGIYGHSQGGTIAPLIASRSKDVAFVIAASGVGVPVYEQDLYRVGNGVRGAGFTEEETARAMKFYRLWLEVARTGEGWERVAAAIPEVRDEKWYELVAPPPRDAFVWRWYQRVADYDSVRYWEKVQVPVLLVYGERDQTVPVAQSIARIDKALRKARNMDFTFIELPRAGHDLNVSRDPGQPFEWSRLAPGFADLMTAWILQRTRI